MIKSIMFQAVFIHRNNGFPNRTSIEDQGFYVVKDGKGVINTMWGIRSRLKRS